MISLVVIVHLLHALQTSLSCHELKDIVHGKSAPDLSLTGRRFEA